MTAERVCVNSLWSYATSPDLCGAILRDWVGRGLFDCVSFSQPSTPDLDHVAVESRVAQLGSRDCATVKELLHHLWSGYQTLGTDFGFLIATAGPIIERARLFLRGLPVDASWLSAHVQLHVGETNLPTDDLLLYFWELESSFHLNRYNPSVGWRDGVKPLPIECLVPSTHWSPVRTEVCRLFQLYIAYTKAETVRARTTRNLLHYAWADIIPRWVSKAGSFLLVLDSTLRGPLSDLYRDLRWVLQNLAAGWSAPLQPEPPDKGGAKSKGGTRGEADLNWRSGGRPTTKGVGRSRGDPVKTATPVDGKGEVQVGPDDAPVAGGNSSSASGNGGTVPTTTAEPPKPGTCAPQIRVDPGIILQTVFGDVEVTAMDSDDFMDPKEKDEGLGSSSMESAEADQLAEWYNTEGDEVSSISSGIMSRPGVKGGVGSAVHPDAVDDERRREIDTLKAEIVRQQAEQEKKMKQQMEGLQQKMVEQQTEYRDALESVIRGNEQSVTNREEAFASELQNRELMIRKQFEVELAQQQENQREAYRAEAVERLSQQKVELESHHQSTVQQLQASQQVVLVSARSEGALEARRALETELQQKLAAQKVEFDSLAWESARTEGGLEARQALELELQQKLAAQKVEFDSLAQTKVAQAQTEHRQQLAHLETARTEAARERQMLDARAQANQQALLTRVDNSNARAGQLEKELAEVRARQAAAETVGARAQADRGELQIRATTANARADRLEKELDEALSRQAAAEQKLTEIEFQSVRDDKSQIGDEEEQQALVLREAELRLRDDECRTLGVQVVGLEARLDLSQKASAGQERELLAERRLRMERETASERALAAERKLRNEIELTAKAQADGHAKTLAEIERRSALLEAKERRSRGNASPSGGAKEVKKGRADLEDRIGAQLEGVVSALAQLPDAVRNATQGTTAVGPVASPEGVSGGLLVTDEAQQYQQSHTLLPGGSPGIRPAPGLSATPVNPFLEQIQRAFEDHRTATDQAIQASIAEQKKEQDRVRNDINQALDAVALKLGGNQEGRPPITSQPTDDLNCTADFGTTGHPYDGGAQRRRLLRREEERGGAIIPGDRKIYGDGEGEHPNREGRAPGKPEFEERGGAVFGFRGTIAWLGKEQERVVKGQLSDAAKADVVMRLQKYQNNVREALSYRFICAGKDYSSFCDGVDDDTYRSSRVPSRTDGDATKVGTAQRAYRRLEFREEMRGFYHLRADQDGAGASSSSAGLCGRRNEVFASPEQIDQIRDKCVPDELPRSWPVCKSLQTLVSNAVRRRATVTRTGNTSLPPLALVAPVCKDTLKETAAHPIKFIENLEQRLKFYAAYDFDPTALETMKFESKEAKSAYTRVEGTAYQPDQELCQFMDFELGLASDCELDYQSALSSLLRDRYIPTDRAYDSTVTAHNDWADAHRRQQKKIEEYGYYAPPPKLGSACFNAIVLGPGVLSYHFIEQLSIQLQTAKKNEARFEGRQFDPNEPVIITLEEVLQWCEGKGEAVNSTLGRKITRRPKGSSSWGGSSSGTGSRGQKRFDGGSFCGFDAGFDGLQNAQEELFLSFGRLGLAPDGSAFAGYRSGHSTIYNNAGVEIQDLSENGGLLAIDCDAHTYEEELASDETDRERLAMADRVKGAALKGKGKSRGKKGGGKKGHASSAKGNTESPGAVTGAAGENRAKGKGGGPAWKSRLVCGKQHSSEVHSAFDVLVGVNIAAGTGVIVMKGCVFCMEKRLGLMAKVNSVDVWICPGSLQDRRMKLTKKDLPTGQLCGRRTKASEPSALSAKVTAVCRSGEDAFRKFLEEGRSGELKAVPKDVGYLDQAIARAKAAPSVAMDGSKKEAMRAYLYSVGTEDEWDFLADYWWLLQASLDGDLHGAYAAARVHDNTEYERILNELSGGEYDDAAVVYRAGTAVQLPALPQPGPPGAATRVVPPAPGEPTADTPAPRIDDVFSKLQPSILPTETRPSAGVPAPAPPGGATSSNFYKHLGAGNFSNTLGGELKTTLTPADPNLGRGCNRYYSSMRSGNIEEESRPAPCLGSRAGWRLKDYLCSELQEVQEPVDRDTLNDAHWRALAGGCRHNGIRQFADVRGRVYRDIGTQFAVWSRRVLVHTPSSNRLDAPNVDWDSCRTWSTIVVEEPLPWWEEQSSEAGALVPSAVVAAASSSSAAVGLGGGTAAEGPVNSTGDVSGGNRLQPLPREIPASNLGTRSYSKDSRLSIRAVVGQSPRGGTFRGFREQTWSRSAVPGVVIVHEEVAAERFSDPDWDLHRDTNQREGRLAFDDGCGRRFVRVFFDRGGKDVYYWMEWVAVDAESERIVTRDEYGRRLREHQAAGTEEGLDRLARWYRGEPNKAEDAPKPHPTGASPLWGKPDEVAGWRAYWAREVDKCGGSEVQNELKVDLRRPSKGKVFEGFHGRVQWSRSPVPGIIIAYTEVAEEIVYDEGWNRVRRDAEDEFQLCFEYEDLHYTKFAVLVQPGGLHRWWERKIVDTARGLPEIVPPTKYHQMLRANSSPQNLLDQSRHANQGWPETPAVCGKYYVGDPYHAPVEMKGPEHVVAGRVWGSTADLARWEKEHPAPAAESKVPEGWEICHYWTDDLVQVLEDVGVDILQDAAWQQLARRCAERKQRRFVDKAGRVFCNIGNDPPAWNRRYLMHMSSGEKLDAPDVDWGRCSGALVALSRPVDGSPRAKPVATGGWIRGARPEPAGPVAASPRPGVEEVARGVEPTLTPPAIGVPLPTLQAETDHKPGSDVIGGGDAGPPSQAAAEPGKKVWKPPTAAKRKQKERDCRLIKIPDTTAPGVILVLGKNELHLEGRSTPTDRSVSNLTLLVLLTLYLIFVSVGGYAGAVHVCCHAAADRGGQSLVGKPQLPSAERSRTLIGVLFWCFVSVWGWLAVAGDSVTVIGAALLFEILWWGARVGIAVLVRTIEEDATSETRRTTIYDNDCIEHNGEGRPNSRGANFFLDHGWFASLDELATRGYEVGVSYVDVSCELTGIFAETKGETFDQFTQRCGYEPLDKTRWDSRFVRAKLPLKEELARPKLGSRINYVVHRVAVSQQVEQKYLLGRISENVERFLHGISYDTEEKDWGDRARTVVIILLEFQSTDTDLEKLCCDARLKMQQTIQNMTHLKSEVRAQFDSGTYLVAARAGQGDEAERGFVRNLLQTVGHEDDYYQYGVGLSLEQAASLQQREDLCLLPRDRGSAGTRDYDGVWQTTGQKCSLSMRDRGVCHFEVEGGLGSRVLRQLLSGGNPLCNLTEDRLLTGRLTTGESDTGFVRELKRRTHYAQPEIKAAADQTYAQGQWLEAQRTGDRDRPAFGPEPPPSDGTPVGAESRGRSRRSCRRGIAGWISRGPFGRALRWCHNLLLDLDGFAVAGNDAGQRYGRESSCEYSAEQLAKLANEACMQIGMSPNGRTVQVKSDPLSNRTYLAAHSETGATPVTQVMWDSGCATGRIPSGHMLGNLYFFATFGLPFVVIDGVQEKAHFGTPDAGAQSESCKVATVFLWFAGHTAAADGSMRFSGIGSNSGLRVPDGAVPGGSRELVEERDFFDHLQKGIIYSRIVGHDTEQRGAQVMVVSWLFEDDSLAGGHATMARMGYAMGSSGTIADQYGAYLFTHLYSVALSRVVPTYVLRTPLRERNQSYNELLKESVGRKGQQISAVELRSLAEKKCGKVEAPPTRHCRILAGLQEETPPLQQTVTPGGTYNRLCSYKEEETRVAEDEEDLPPLGLLARGAGRLQKLFTQTGVRRARFAVDPVLRWSGPLLDEVAGDKLDEDEELQSTNFHRVSYYEGETESNGFRSHGRVLEQHQKAYSDDEASDTDSEDDDRDFCARAARPAVSELNLSAEQEEAGDAWSKDREGIDRDAKRVRALGPTAFGWKLIVLVCGLIFALLAEYVEAIDAADPGRNVFKVPNRGTGKLTQEQTRIAIKNLLASDAKECEGVCQKDMAKGFSQFHLSTRLRRFEAFDKGREFFSEASLAAAETEFASKYGAAHIVGNEGDVFSKFNEGEVFSCDESYRRAHPPDEPVAAPADADWTACTEPLPDVGTCPVFDMEDGETAGEAREMTFGEKLSFLELEEPDGFLRGIPSRDKASAIRKFSWAKASASPKALKRFLCQVNYLREAYLSPDEDVLKGYLLDKKTLKQMRDDPRARAAFVRIRRAVSDMIEITTADVAAARNWKLYPPSQSPIIRIVIDSSRVRVNVYGLQLQNGKLRLFLASTRKFSREQVQRIGASSVLMEVAGLLYFARSILPRLPHAAVAIYHDNATLSTSQLWTLATSVTTIRSLVSMTTEILGAFGERETYLSAVNGAGIMADAGTKMDEAAPPGSEMTYEQLKQKLIELFGTGKITEEEIAAEAANLEAEDRVAGGPTEEQDEDFGEEVPSAVSVDAEQGLQRIFALQTYASLWTVPKIEMRANEVTTLRVTTGDFREREDGQVYSADLAPPSVDHVTATPVCPLVTKVDLMLGVLFKASPTRDVAVTPIFRAVELHGGKRYDLKGLTRVEVVDRISKEDEHRKSSQRSYRNVHECTVEELEAAVCDSPILQGANVEQVNNEIRDRLKKGKLKINEDDFFNLVLKRADEEMRDYPVAGRQLVRRLLLTLRHSFWSEGRDFPTCLYGSAYHVVRKDARFHGFRKIALAPILDRILRFQLLEHFLEGMAREYEVSMGLPVQLSALFLAVRKLSALGRLIVDATFLNTIFEDAVYPLAEITDIWKKLSSEIAAITRREYRRLREVDEAAAEELREWAEEVAKGYRGTGPKNAEDQKLMEKKEIGDLPEIASRVPVVIRMTRYTDLENSDKNGDSAKLQISPLEALPPPKDPKANFAPTKNQKTDKDIKKASGSGQRWVNLKWTDEWRPFPRLLRLFKRGDPRHAVHPPKPCEYKAWEVMPDTEAEFLEQVNRPGGRILTIKGADPQTTRLGFPGPVFRCPGCVLTERVPGQYSVYSCGSLSGDAGLGVEADKFAPPAVEEKGEKGVSPNASNDASGRSAAEPKVKAAPKAKGRRGRKKKKDVTADDLGVAAGDSDVCPDLVHVPWEPAPKDGDDPVDLVGTSPDASAPAGPVEPESSAPAPDDPDGRDVDAPAPAEAVEPDPAELDPVTGLPAGVDEGLVAPREAETGESETVEDLFCEDVADNPFLDSEETEGGNEPARARVTRDGVKKILSQMADLLHAKPSGRATYRQGESLYEKYTQCLEHYFPRSHVYEPEEVAVHDFRYCEADDLLVAYPPHTTRILQFRDDGQPLRCGTLFRFETAGGDLIAQQDCLYAFYVGKKIGELDVDIDPEFRGALQDGQRLQCTEIFARLDGVDKGLSEETIKQHIKNALTESGRSATERDVREARANARRFVHQAGYLFVYRSLNRKWHVWLPTVITTGVNYLTKKYGTTSVCRAVVDFEHTARNHIQQTGLCEAVMQRGYFCDSLLREVIGLITRRTICTSLTRFPSLEGPCRGEKTTRAGLSLSSPWRKSKVVQIMVDFSEAYQEIRSDNGSHFKTRLKQLLRVRLEEELGEGARLPKVRHGPHYMARAQSKVERPHQTASRSIRAALFPETGWKRVTTSELRSDEMDEETKVTDEPFEGKWDEQLNKIMLDMKSRRNQEGSSCLHMHRGRGYDLLNIPPIFSEGVLEDGVAAGAKLKAVSERACAARLQKLEERNIAERRKYFGQGRANYGWAQRGTLVLRLRPSKTKFQTYFIRQIYIVVRVYGNSVDLERRDGRSYFGGNPLSIAHVKEILSTRGAVLVYMNESGMSDEEMKIRMKQLQELGVDFLEEIRSRADAVFAAAYRSSSAGGDYITILVDTGTFNVDGYRAATQRGWKLAMLSELLHRCETSHLQEMKTQARDEQRTKASLHLLAGSPPGRTNVAIQSCVTRPGNYGVACVTQGKVIDIHPPYKHGDEFDHDPGLEGRVTVVENGPGILSIGLYQINSGTNLHRFKTRQRWTRSLGKMIKAAQEVRHVVLLVGDFSALFDPAESGTHMQTENEDGRIPSLQPEEHEDFRAMLTELGFDRQPIAMSSDGYEHTFRLISEPPSHWFSLTHAVLWTSPHVRIRGQEISSDEVNQSQLALAGDKRFQQLEQERLDNLERGTKAHDPDTDKTELQELRAWESDQQYFQPTTSCFGNCKRIRAAKEGQAEVYLLHTQHDHCALRQFKVYSSGNKIAENNYYKFLNNMREEQWIKKRIGSGSVVAKERQKKKVKSLLLKAKRD
eukprot:g11956.t1